MCRRICVWSGLTYVLRPSKRTAIDRAQLENMKGSHSDLQSGSNEPKRRLVGYSTFQKWRQELDKECGTVSWLDCDTNSTGAKKTATKLKCKMCIKFKNKICGRRNYSDKWVVGADSVRTSNIKDHARTDQHQHAMTLLAKEHAEAKGQGPASYAPIVRAVHELPEDELAKLRVKSDIAHFIATEKLAFSKYPVLCELEAHHGVNVGSDYVYENAAKTFCHYIAESRREELAKNLASAKFFSLLMDGSTDKAKIDDELFLVLWCDVNGADEKVHTRMSYFAVARPETVTASGLFDTLQSSLQRIGISAINAEECKQLNGIGTDGASANIASGGLKGLVEKEVPWVFWMWCLAHRLELAIKDAQLSISSMRCCSVFTISTKDPKKSAENWKKS